MERVTPWKPIKIALAYSDTCEQCNKEMKIGEVGVWRGKNSKVLHESCWKEAMSISIEELINW